jgi:2'-5' RNA ligase
MDTLFLAFAVPSTIADALEPLYQHYGTVMEKRQPREKLHLTLVWLGEMAADENFLKKIRVPLPQSFVPTVRLTHVGRGRARDQLWAFAEAAGPIMAIREQMLARLKDIGWDMPKQGLHKSFTPHIKVGTLYDQMSHIGVADHPFITSYAVQELILYKGSPGAHQAAYTPLASISLI